VKKTKILVSLPNELIDEIDGWAEDGDLDRSELIEAILTYFTEHPETIIDEEFGEEEEEEPEEA